MAAGLIPQGEIDGRDIQDIRAVELVGYVQWHFFAGIAGWPLALRLAGWSEDKPILTASCPCQPFSNAGQQKGESDERHLWPVVHELIKELKPSVCIGEQVSSKLGRQWLSRVRTDLEGVGYAVGASDLCAAGVGAPHIRQRLYWVADRLVNADGQRYDGVHALLREEERGRTASDLLETTRSSAIGGLADLCSTGLAQRERDGRVQREALERIQGQATIGDSGFSGLANAQASEWRWPEREANGRWWVEEIRRSSPTFWSDFALVPCADGKTRRIKSGLQCLVNGIPAGVVSGSDPSLQEVEATTEARVMRLKGYGNAICVPLAAVFIRSAMGALEDY